jgi:hypothetical protein
VTLGTATAAAAGQNALLQTVAAAEGGSYRIVVGGADSTTGAYSVHVILNAAQEAEGKLAGVDNNSLATAQDIDGSFVQLGTSDAARGAVLGTIDAGGYTATAAPSSFVDISSSGSISTATGDDSSQLLSATQLGGFTFPFFGTNYTSVGFSTNGLITFPTGNSTFTNTNLSASPSQAAIAVLWDDLFNPNTGTGAASSRIYWQVIGAGADQQLVIQWNNVRRLGGSTLFSFQAVLSANGAIQLNYGAAVTTTNVVSNATVGIKAAGTSDPERLLIGFNQPAGPLVGPNLSTRIAQATASADIYSLTLSAGESLALALTGPAASGLTMELRDAAGIVLATGVGGATNLSRLISSFTATAAGDYYVQIAGSTVASYSLVAARNAAFDAEPNDSFATAQSLAFPAAERGVLGAIAGSEDWYAIDVTSTSGTLRIQTSTPADGPAEFVNHLNPRLELYDPSNTLVASGVVLPDGRNETIQHLPATPGVYRVRVRSEADTSGEYFLAATMGANPALILDDSDQPSPNGTFSTTGDWGIGGGENVGRHGNVHYAFGESFLLTEFATWTFSLPSQGRYRVSATWYTNPLFTDLWSIAAPFEVSDGPTVLGTSLINTQLVPNDLDDAGSAWEDLGVFDLTSTTLIVRLFTARDDKYVVADAIRVERIADLSSADQIHVTMNGEYGVNPLSGTGTGSFGTTDFNVPVEKTFTISNRGAAPLTLTLPITVTGSVFTVATQPTLTTLAPGQATSFVVQMTGAEPGNHTATVSIHSSDEDDDPYNFTVAGTALSTYVLDDGDPGYARSPALPDPGAWGYVAGAGRGGRDNAHFYDYDYNLNHPLVEEVATWTFNVTPGVYRVSATWPSFGVLPYFEDAAPFTIFDGTVEQGVIVGGRNLNQQLPPDDSDYPPGFGFPPAVLGVTAWERIGLVNITGNTLTVQLQAIDPGQYVLADSVLIDRIAPLPEVAELDLTFGALRKATAGIAFNDGSADVAVQDGGKHVVADAALATTDWSDELDEAAVVLADDRAAESADGLAAGTLAVRHTRQMEAIDAALSDWL